MSAPVLLDFSNVRVGGGLLVASSTLRDIARAETLARHPWLADAHIWLSPGTAGNLTVPIGSLPGTVAIRETRASPWAVLKPPRRRFDVRFTLFGPTYTGRLARYEIAGFAEVLLVYDPHEYGLAPHPPSLRYAVTMATKRHLVKQADRYVTETAVIADRLSQRYGIARDHIEVVPNRPHPLVAAVPIVPARTGDPAGLDLFYPTRAYPHKNLTIIGPAAELFTRRTGRRLTLHVTLRPDEWAVIPERARRWMHNHGEVTPHRLVELYPTIDAVFFPSLLEASSATPLEANALGIPLLASDRGFVRASAAAAEWFDPEDPESVAAALERFDRDRAGAWVRAHAVALAYRDELTRRSRTDAYLDIVARARRA